MNRSLEHAIAERIQQDSPIRVGVVGSGACGRMIIRHLVDAVPFIRLVAVANRTQSRAIDTLTQVGVANPFVAAGNADLAAAIERRETAVTAPDVLCAAADVDVIVEVTGTVEFGARMVLSAIEHRKHVVLVNAELDSTLGPVLKARADRAGVTLTHTDGEEPGVAMSLLRYVKSIGLRPVAAGNIKGMIDQYRTPDTQREFAARLNMDAKKVASFADGTKLSMETTILANATGFRVGRAGMYGPSCSHVRDIAKLLPAKDLLAGGLVDYALGAEPHTGAFVVVYEDDRNKRKDLAYFKMGDGPYYVFYTPYHLPHLQIAATIARAALLNDPTVAPLSSAVCEVSTYAKRALKAGELLDGVGGFLTYGVIDNADWFAASKLLPMGVSEGCRLIRDIPRDQPIGYADVVVPEGRLCDQLRSEQERSKAASSNASV
jgi:predicted homoserine dehydrogenase-like protein